MAIIQFQVPDFLAENHEDTVRFLAGKLYGSGKLSLGQAAEMIGLCKSEFANILVQCDVNYINYSFEDVMADIERISRA